jgi:hypothetical protein
MNKATKRTKECLLYPPLIFKGLLYLAIKINLKILTDVLKGGNRDL